ncbi:MAG TPA: dethiobiotin synthase, partial [bacterium]|nr:dethiobiotin synthase [bacterium]
MKSIAIIGTDTNVGKTIVTAGIYNSLKKLKLNVEAQKWISTGDTYNFSDDLKFVYQIEKLNNAQNIFAKYNFNIIIQPENNPYSFKIPCSPHLAQKLENKKIQISKIIKSYNYFQDKCDFLLIETAGGLFSPLNEKYNFADLLKKLNLPVILVIKNVLGAIN